MGAEAYAEIKPTPKQFGAYLKVQMSGLTNMFDTAKVKELAETFFGETLEKEHIRYIMAHYNDLLEEYKEGK